MDILNIYNPANLNITEEEISAMRQLTTAEIEQLAKAYPNQPRGNAYLVLIDKTEPDLKKQKFSLSTWGNLHNLYKLGQTNYVPFNFRSKFQRQATQPAQAPQRTLDLTNEQAQNAEGLKINTGEGSIPAVLEVKPEDLNANASPELKYLQVELQKAIDEKAHHMTIRSIQAKIECFGK